MSFTPEFLDEIRLRVPLPDVVGRRVKLVRRGREYSGLCPFHKEKTPSFTVNDDKGFYHCFGCGAHGDVIGFVMNSEGLGFPETVERLAGEAGLEMPSRSPVDREKERVRTSLIEVMEIAAGWFESGLSADIGRQAREYLDHRGLTAKAISSFRIGYAPDRRTALKDALMARGIEEEMLVAGGLLIRPEDGSATFDRFRHRIMFPIRDARGRVIAFGGRALSPSAKAKYLNSPETASFHKGSVLFNMDLARPAARESGSVIVAEGYMDVIALAQAGFGQAVAPLGTAVTEDQLRLLWRMGPEPVFCLDGDRAGRAAAFRVLDRALPLLKPGYSLRFALLPEGQDPDSLIAEKGAAAFQEVLDSARPLADMLWEREITDSSHRTPEQKAGLEARINQVVRSVSDPTLRNYYQQDYRQRLADLFGTTGIGYAGRDSQSSQRGQGNQGRYGGRPGQFGRGGRGPGSVRATSSLKNSKLVRGLNPRRLTRQVFEIGVLRLTLQHPSLVERLFEELGSLYFEDPELDKIRGEIIGFASQMAKDGETVSSRLEKGALHTYLVSREFGETVKRIEHQETPIDWAFLRPDASLDKAEAGMTWLISRFRYGVDLSEAESILASDMCDENVARLSANLDEIAVDEAGAGSVINEMEGKSEDFG